MNIDDEIIELSSFVGLMEDRGVLRERIRSILQLGTIRFGASSPSQEETLRRTRDLDRLELILNRILSASSWEELLQE